MLASFVLYDTCVFLAALVGVTLFALVWTALWNSVFCSTNPSLVTEEAQMHFNHSTWSLNLILPYGVSGLAGTRAVRALPHFTGSPFAQIGG